MPRSMAVTMKREVFTRATGTPELRAAFGSPPEAKIQLPNRVRRQNPGRDQRNEDEPEDFRRECRGPSGAPFGKVSMMPLLPSQENRPVEGVAGKDPAQSGLSATASLHAAKLGCAAARPFQADERQAAQNEEEGKRDDEGRQAASAW